MKIGLIGYNGRMGQAITKLSEAGANRTITGGSSRKGYFLIDQNEHLHVQFSEWVNKVDLFMDFSNATGNETFLNDAESLHDRRLIIGTTGLSIDTEKRWECLTSNQGWTILQAPNTSLGIIATLMASQFLSKCLAAYDIEIHETHHRLKADQPSGTALLLANSLAGANDKIVNSDRKTIRNENEIGVSCSRGGSVFGEHSIRFLGPKEEVSISHRAYSLDLFAEGALFLSTWLTKQKPGFYHVRDLNIDDFEII